MKKIVSEYIFEVAKQKQNKFLCKRIENLKHNIQKVCFDVDEQFEKQLGRDAGHYVCLNFDDLLIYDIYAKEYLIEIIKKEIKNLLKINQIDAKKVLIVGLGNPKYACDSVGKLTTDRILITTPYLDRKMFSPKEMAEIYALSLGVYGTTGIDSAKLVKSVCKIIEPDVVIAIDSLVATESKNLAKSIQISDTKLSPGGGVGNVREDISQKVIGAKVFAIGVPLVVKMKDKTDHLIVTPNDVEKQVSVISKILATSINKTFTNLSKQDYLQLVS